jgi:hypothetical protein
MGSAVIFSGSDVKSLKSNLDLNGQSKILSGTVDPSSVATAGNPGSLYLNSSTGVVYRKTDSGTTTNWVQLTSPAFAQGAIVFGSGGTSVTVDASNLFYDDGANRLGLLTATPETTLDVRGTIQCLNTIQSRSGNDLNVEAVGTNRDIFFRANATTYMAVQGSTASVGVGTSSPLSKLHVSEGDIRLSTASAAKFVGFYQGATQDWVIQHNADRSMKIDSPGSRILALNETGGLVGIGTASPGGKLTILAATTTPGAGVVFSAANSAGTGIFFNGDLAGGVTTGENGASAAMRIRKDGTTSRSINAAGTLNASGADYAEYMTKDVTNDTITAGEVCGVKSNGKLTKLWSESIHFVVKSTNPCIVGGDNWFNRDKNEGETDEEYSIAMEAARNTVDRIAFCGQVPCTIPTVGVNSGDWVVPIEGASDAIALSVVTDASISFAQYKKSVGKVLKIVDASTVILGVGIK